MSFFDKLDTVKYWANRFLWPTLFLIIGVVLLRMGLVPNIETLNNGETIEVKQNSQFLYASLFFIFASVVWFLFLFNIFRTALSYVIMAVLAAVSIGVLYWDYKIIQDKLVYDAAYDARDVEIRTRMYDIKNAELAYREMHGKYTANVDSLIDFIKNGEKMKILKVGAIPGRAIYPEERTMLYGPKDNRPLDNLMTEVEAARLAKMPQFFPDLKGFKRDTSYIPVMDALFKDERYIENRNKLGATLEFHPDSLKYVPFTKDLARIDTSSIERDELKIQTIRIQMTHPMQSKTTGDTSRFVYTIGALDENHLRENWK
ncbi:hypothetical protein [Crocinitomix catalasitica]|uniref:hypothetical protein n=1 Tax=Crocinitomix catalasitica TaxID=184607 RepID=UPI0004812C0B|nr:hypothetical protein [Crocinitomix catalasitica]